MIRKIEEEKPKKCKCENYDAEFAGAWYPMVDKTKCPVHGNLSISKIGGGGDMNRRKALREAKKIVDPPMFVSHLRYQSVVKRIADALQGKLRPEPAVYS